MAYGDGSGLNEFKKPEILEYWKKGTMDKVGHSRSSVSDYFLNPISHYFILAGFQYFREV